MLMSPGPQNYWNELPLLTRQFTNSLISKSLSSHSDQFDGLCFSIAGFVLDNFPLPY